MLRAKPPSSLAHILQQHSRQPLEYRSDRPLHNELRARLTVITDMLNDLEQVFASEPGSAPS